MFVTYESKSLLRVNDIGDPNYFIDLYSYVEKSLNIIYMWLLKILRRLRWRWNTARVSKPILDHSHHMAHQVIDPPSLPTQDSYKEHNIMSGVWQIAYLFHGVQYLRKFLYVCRIGRHIVSQHLWQSIWICGIHKLQMPKSEGKAKCFNDGPVNS